MPDISVTFGETTMNITHKVNPFENDRNHGVDLFASLVGVLQRTSVFC